MAFSHLLLKLGNEVEDAYEGQQQTETVICMKRKPPSESFLLFSQAIPSQNLGFVDPKASSLEITVGDQSLDIQQSPSLLSSDRAGGTTGAGTFSFASIAVLVHLSFP